MYLEDSGVEISTQAGCIDVFNNLMDIETANDIIEIFENSHKDEDCPLVWTPAAVGHDNRPGEDFRSNVLMHIYAHECHEGCRATQALDFLREKWVNCVRYYQEKYDVMVDFDEGFQLLKYGPGKEYKAHADQGPGHEWRTVSGIIYLNPQDYEGGGTYFINYDENVKADKPSMAIFPSNYAYSHRARAVLSGTKYAIVSWMGCNPLYNGAFNG